jgi:hypothetical protein
LPSNGRCLQSHYLATARHAALLLLYKSLLILAKVLLFLTFQVFVLANIFTGFRVVGELKFKVAFMIFSQGGIIEIYVGISL